MTVSECEINFGSCSRLSTGSHKTLTVTNSTNGKVTAFLAVPDWQGYGSPAPSHKVFQVCSCDLWEEFTPLVLAKRQCSPCGWRRYAAPFPFLTPLPHGPTPFLVLSGVSLTMILVKASQEVCIQPETSLNSFLRATVQSSATPLYSLHLNPLFLVQIPAHRFII